MSDCHRCAALRMIAEDPTLTKADMVQLAWDALNSQPPCGRPTDQFSTRDYELVVGLPDPHYNPDDPDNPILEILMPSVAKKNG